MAAEAMGSNGKPAQSNLGREKLAWSSGIWDRIDAHVRDEIDRTRITTKFLPIHTGSGPSMRTVATDVIDEEPPRTLTIKQEGVTGLTEKSVAFSLSKEQYEDEERLGTAVTLATRAANMLAQDMDEAVL